jgi:LysR family glycine cleavage system transcriptional activator
MAIRSSLSLVGSIPLSGRLPSLNALRAFEAAARHGSFKLAAAELHVTTAAVSQQVKLLEQDLGTTLLRRVDGRWVLTPAGAVGLADLRRGFDGLRQGVQRIRDHRRHRLTVSVVPSFAATWLVPRLDRFRRLHPEIDLLIEATTAVADLARGDADLAIRYSAGQPAGLAAALLLGDEVCPVCSPRLLEGPHGLRQPADLRHHTLLHSDWTTADSGWPDWQAWLATAGVTGVDAGRGPRFNQHSMALQAAIEGHGVALGSTSHVVDDLAAGRLVCPFELTLPTSFAYYVVTLPEAASRPEIAALRDWLLGEAAGAA